MNFFIAAVMRSKLSRAILFSISLFILPATVQAIRLVPDLSDFDWLSDWKEQFLAEPELTKAFELAFPGRKVKKFVCSTSRHTLSGWVDVLAKPL